MLSPRHSLASLRTRSEAGPALVISERLVQEAGWAGLEGPPRAQHAPFAKL